MSLPALNTQARHAFTSRTRYALRGARHEWPWGSLHTQSAPRLHASAGPTRWARLLAPRYWPTWAGIGMMRLLSLLPFSVLLAIGTLLGALLRRLPVRFVRIARRNIELCLPQLEPAARKRLLRRHFASLGIAIAETALAWWCPAARLAALSQVEGVEHLREAFAGGRG